MSQHFVPRQGSRRGSENALLMNRYDCELARDGQKWRFKRVTIDNAWVQGDPEILTHRQAVRLCARNRSRSVHLQSLAASALQQYLERRGVAGLSIPSDDLWRYLEQCRYITRTEQGDRWPTLAGVVLFASNAADILPQARISIESRIGNDTRALEFTGPLVAFRDTFEEFLSCEIRLLTTYEGLDRHEVPQYPILAVREAAFNAIAHRDYTGGARVHITMSDSAVIIRSPGAPLRPLSIARLRRFDAPPYSRNPHIAMAMHHLGLMEEKGSELTRMREAMLDHGLPEPTFSFDDGYVVVTLSARKQRGRRTTGAANRVSQLSEAERRVFEVGCDEAAFGNYGVCGSIET